MGPPGGARNAVDPRFISLFNMFEIQFPSNENLRTIYQVTHAIGHMYKTSQANPASTENAVDCNM